MEDSRIMKFMTVSVLCWSKFCVPL